MSNGKKGFEVLNPNLGLYLDRGALSIPKRGLKDCLNVRIKEGRVVRDNMGWGPFPNPTKALNLDGMPVTGIESFFQTDGGQILMFFTTKDTFQYVEASEKVTYITPRYEVGTVNVTNGSSAVTGVGTLWQSAAITAGNKMHFGNKAEVELNPTGGWYEILSVNSETSITLTTNYSGATDTGIDYCIRYQWSGDILDPWFVETFPNGQNVGTGENETGDRVYMCNNFQVIYAWDGAADQIYAPAFVTPDLDLLSCAAMARYKNMMLYVNILDGATGDQRPYSVRNSAIGEPENVSTLEASEFIVHDGVDQLLAAIALGETMVFYGERSITLSQFVGGALGFINRTVIQGIGPMSGRAISDFGDYHTFLGPDAQYRFDGLALQETGFHVWREVIRKQSPQRLNLVQSHIDEENGEVLWIVPLNDDADADAGPPELAHVEHYLELVSESDPTPVTIRELPATAMGYFSRETTLTWAAIGDTWETQNFRWNDRFLQAAFPFNLMGTNTGEIFIINNQDDQDGASIRSFVRFGRRPLGDIRRKGTILRIYPMAEQAQGATYNLDVKINLADEPAGPTSLADTIGYDLTQTTEKHFVSVRRTGRYVELGFETNGAGAPFVLEGYDMDVVPAGER